MFLLLSIGTMHSLNTLNHKTEELRTRQNVFALQKSFYALLQSPPPFPATELSTIVGSS